MSYADEILIGEGVALIETADPRFQEDSVRSLLQDAGAKHIELVED